MQTTVRCYQVNRRQISFVKFILEAYDNIAVLSTLDAQRGRVKVTIAPGCELLVEGILQSLAESCGMTGERSTETDFPD